MADGLRVRTTIPEHEVTQGPVDSQGIDARIPTFLTNFRELECRVYSTASVTGATSKLKIFEHTLHMRFVPIPWTAMDISKYFLIRLQLSFFDYYSYQILCSLYSISPQVQFYFS